MGDGWHLTIWLVLWGIDRMWMGAGWHLTISLFAATNPCIHKTGGKGLPFFWTTIDGAATANGEIAKQSFSIHKQVGTYGG
jgi:hypothetical protein